MLKNFLWLLLLGSLMVSCELSVPEPVTPNATREVRSLLKMLYQNQGEVILSGQHNYARRPATLTESTDSVIARTGHTPVIWGSDFGNVRMRKQMIWQAQHEYEKGHIITLMWHAPCPVDTMPRRVNPVRYMPSEKEWHDIITPGTKFHSRLIADLDEVAKWLKVLEEKEIPVLWRPYHEMNGVWFWWGNQPGELGYQALYKIMYERFTHHHKLKNLVWVWNANGPRDWKDDEAYDYHLFFPGIEYVDVLATDIYKRDYKQSHHDDLLALAEEKLIALGEIGKPPTHEELDSQPMWSWFMIWANWPFKYIEEEELVEFYAYPKMMHFNSLQN